MKEINDLADYIKNFDQLTYPTQLYEDMVVNGQQADNKFELMGAWKTGSIRLADERYAGQSAIVHTDVAGNNYLFTGRWKTDAPVGYAVWQEIAAHQEQYRQRIPTEFAQEQPDVVTELIAKPGFGFIWALFVLHCYYPRVYPLYDQHVYRAYKYHESEGKISRQIAPNKWSEYVKYRDYFLKLLEKQRYEYWELDRGLWSFGKAVKRKKSSQEITLDEINIQSTKTVSFMPVSKEELWVYSTTLGGKEKKFYWKIDSDLNLNIKRQFKSVKTSTSNDLSVGQINQIVDYVSQNGEVTLSNNVMKLVKGTEKEGLGKFMLETFSLTTTAAQAASQLAALFVDAGIWKWNEKKRGMSFKANTIDWKDTLRSYYEQKLREVD